MKKLLVLIMALALALSFAACGEDAPKTTQAPTPAPTAAPQNEDKGFTPEQQSLAQDYLDTLAAYNEIIDRINASPELLSDDELVTTMNDLSNAISALDEAFDSPETLTDEVMDAIEVAIEAINYFIAEADAALLELESTPPDSFFGDAFAVPAEIFNYTDYVVTGIALAPEGSNKFGGNQLPGAIKKGEILKTELYLTEDVLVWNMLVGLKSEDYEFEAVAYFVDFTEADLSSVKIYLASTEGGDVFANVN